MKDIESNIVNELIKVGLNKYEAIESSKKSIYLDIWADDYEDWYEKLLEAHSRGVDIVSVAYGKINNEIGKVYYHEMLNNS